MRNLFYNRKIMKSSKFSIPVINVGNLSMGGTGKTPHVEYLIRLLKEDFKTATLSRGFGRKERGFIIADAKASANRIGDEPFQYYKKFKDDIVVSVEANRVLGAMDLFRIHPDINVLLLDDAYQHRSIYAGINILLTDYNHPFYKDFILPVGNLRESRLGKKRADIIIVTKCPSLSDGEKNKIKSKIKPTTHQQLFFSHIKYGDVCKFNGEKINLSGSKVILVTGIANAAPLKSYLESNAEVLHHFNFPDHHTFKESELEEIHNIFDKFAAESPLIVTTEKDAMRLLDKAFEKVIEKYPWCYQQIEIEIDNHQQFDELILKYVKENNPDS
ncbi:tetraacyldisaccharide 4'-kinase [Paracrocinitomix mangrovi]|nr:tetraacyldisaccharide 4'-kinase [Paracrocinitomix mangrovi]